MELAGERLGAGRGGHDQESTAVRRDDPWLNLSNPYASVYDGRMDGLAGLLDGPRARGAFLLRILLDAPWSVRLQDEAPLSVTAVVRGHLWVCPDGEEPTRLEAGDVVVWVGSDHWTIADDPATPTQIVIHPGQVCTTVDGHVVVEEMSQGVRSWGNSEVGETVLLTGVYLLEGEVTRRLLRALPAHAGPARRRARHPAHRPARRGGGPRRARARRRCSTGCSTCC